MTAQGGALMFRLQVHGLSAHACVRDEGVSAVEKFAYLHQGLLEFEARRNAEITHPLYAGMRIKAPINVGIVRAGSWASSVPESLIAEGRAGLVPGEDMATFKTEVATEIARLADDDPWLCEHPPEVTWLNGQFALPVFGRFAARRGAVPGLAGDELVTGPDRSCDVWRGHAPLREHGRDAVCHVRGGRRPPGACPR